MSSQKIYRPIAKVMPIAEEIAEALRPHCERIEIAGSLRRKKTEIGDIEIVAIPKFKPPTFGDPRAGWSEVDKWLDERNHRALSIVKGLKGRGSKRKYVQFNYYTSNQSLYTVDLFLQPDPATWGVNFMIRTGSSDFSRMMVTDLSKGGYKPEEFFFQDGRLWRKYIDTDRAIECLPTPEEIDVFNTLELDWVEPELRV